MKQKLFFIAIFVLILLVWIEAFNAYMIEHFYYSTILQTSDNWELLIVAIIGALIPVIYILNTKKVNLKTLTIVSFIWLFIFSVMHVYTKWAWVWLLWSPATIKLLVNVLLVFAVSLYFIVGLQALWSLIVHRLFHFSRHRTQEMLISFWLWLVVFLIVINFALLLNILMPMLTWVLFLWLWYLIYLQRSELKKYQINIQNLLATISLESLKEHPYRIFAVILLLLSIMYYFYGFNLAYIPYSTAWDANHAYMYYPKIRANNRGIFWNDGPPTTPYLRYSYITIWFSLFWSLKLWIAADTFAVSMNFLSGIFVLMFWTSLMFESVKFFSWYIKQKNESDWFIESLAAYSWWFFLLLWLTSWMWAFLVFIDNKTDLGVMALTALAIMSGIIFLQQIEHDKDSSITHKELVWYIWISGFFFAAAAMSKPTAFQDMVLFWLLLAGLWIGAMLVIGWFLMVIGLIAKENSQWMQHFDLQKSWTGLFLLWLVLSGANTVASWMWKTTVWIRSIADANIRFVKYILVWVAAIVVSLLIVKWPFLAVQSYQQGWSVTKFAKDLFMAKSIEQIDADKLYAQAVSWEAIEATLSLDKIVSQQYDNQKSPAQCLSDYQSTSLEELNKDLIEVEWWWITEDFWRYIWKQWNRQRLFVKPSNRTAEEQKSYWSVRLWYWALRMFVWWEWCHSLSADANLLCENRGLFEQWFDKAGLESLSTKMEQGSVVQQILADVLEDPDVMRIWSTQDPAQLVAQRKKLIDAYQHRVITLDANWTIWVPYKYLMPINVIFNWSLQNLSSYYTDIWFIWIISLLLLIVGFFYALTKKEYHLTLLHTIAILWWIMWWLITHGIIWYAVWLMLWTIIANISLLRYMYLSTKNDTDKTLYFAVFILIVFFGLIQLFFNYMRIGSQWMGWQFAWYRSNVWQPFDLEFKNGWIQQIPSKIDYSLSQKDVFDMQFGHYNKFMDLVRDRADEDGVMIAWTYMAYFLDKQRNLQQDGLLTQFGKYVQDQNMCKTYNRLKKSNYKYLAIDPNISSLANWTSDTLFTRFIADLLPWNNVINRDGIMTMIAKMIDSWYMKHMYSNNLWFQYGMGLTSQELTTYIEQMPIPEVKAYLQQQATQDMSLLRTKMTSARFFGQNEAWYIQQFISYILQQRLWNGQAMADVSYILGKTIEPAKLLPIVNGFMTQQLTPDIEKIFNKELTRDDRFMIMRYINTLSAFKSGKQEDVVWIIQNILNQSFGNSSQLAVFEML